jgi:uncharacterized protein (DUF1778 family)
MYAAKKITKQAQRVSLTESDSLRLLKALEKPQQPNARLLRAARRMP